MACPYADADYDSIATEDSLNLIFGAMKNACESVKSEGIAYPSNVFIERVESVFMNVVKDSVRLPSITAVFDDEAIDADWSNEKMICTFYDDIDDLKAYASFRFIDNSSDNFECELDDPNLNGSFKTFLKTRLDYQESNDLSDLSDPNDPNFISSFESTRVENSQFVSEISNAFNYLKRDPTHPTYLHPSSKFVERIRNVFVECAKEMPVCPSVSDAGGDDTAIIVQFTGYNVMCFFYEETEDTPAKWSFRRIDSSAHIEGCLDNPSFIDTFKTFLILNLQ